ncbi:MAG: hypothetical protein WCY58_05135 [Mariniphaga sp.]|nr:hypothetical protein [Mariniphaga sp.]MDD4226324.1 hypothetical protein [Mariniphaga sp.]MDD4424523.1 hypothetical protein [Mariniphaga sp.]
MTLRPGRQSGKPNGLLKCFAVEIKTGEYRVNHESEKINEKPAEITVAWRWGILR